MDLHKIWGKTGHRNGRFDFAFQTRSLAPFGFFLVFFYFNALIKISEIRFLCCFWAYKHLDIIDPG